MANSDTWYCVGKKVKWGRKKPRRLPHRIGRKSPMFLRRNSRIWTVHSFSANEVFQTGHHRPSPPSQTTYGMRGFAQYTAKPSAAGRIWRRMLPSRSSEPSDTQGTVSSEDFGDSVGALVAHLNPTGQAISAGNSGMVYDQLGYHPGLARSHSRGARTSVPTY